MKRAILFGVAIYLLGGCTLPKVTYTHPTYAYGATVYELNTRQFTPEGTFAAAEAQLPTLKKLGIDIIWIMPIQPIGKLERKGGLGSYYAIKDYCAFNPEFGTRADFESFLNKAHKLGIKVILDWVANHTAPDHPWVENEGWHLRDSLGKLVTNYDWYDIAELNYNKAEMRNAMQESMKWWMDSIGIDGFRCDVAMEVPTDFWEETFAQIRASHPNMFTLAEAEVPELMENAFNMYYGWELHHLMNAVAQEKQGVADLWSYFAKEDTTFVHTAIRMNFTSNHDENSWNGTEFERLGAATDAFAAFTYIVPGMPLIYTGQEYGSDKRLRFFDKDTIAVNSHAPQFALYQKLNAMRKNNPALWSEERGAPMLPIGCDHPSVFACVRTIDGNSVIALFNFSGKTVTATLDFTNLQGTYTAFSGESVKILEGAYKIELAAWQWQIWVK